MFSNISSCRSIIMELNNINNSSIFNESIGKQSSSAKKRYTKIKYINKYIYYNNFGVLFDATYIPLCIDKIIIVHTNIYYTKKNKIYCTQNFIDTIYIDDGHLLGRYNVTIWYYSTYKTNIVIKYIMVDTNHINTVLHVDTHPLFYKKYIILYKDAEIQFLDCASFRNSNFYITQTIRFEHAITKVKFMKNIKTFVYVQCLDEIILLYHTTIIVRKKIKANDDMAVILLNDNWLLEIEKIVLKNQPNEIIKILKNPEYTIRLNKILNYVGLKKTYKQFYTRYLKGTKYDIYLQCNQSEYIKTGLFSNNVFHYNTKIHNPKHLAYSIIQNTSLEYSTQIKKDILKLLNTTEIKLQTDIDDNDMIRNKAFIKIILSRYIIKFLELELKYALLHPNTTASINGQPVRIDEKAQKMMNILTAEFNRKKTDETACMTELDLLYFIFKSNMSIINIFNAKNVIDLAKEHAVKDEIMQYFVLGIYYFNTNNLCILKRIYQTIYSNVVDRNNNAILGLSYFLINTSYFGYNVLFDDKLVELIIKELHISLYNADYVGDISISKFDRDEVVFYKSLVINLHQQKCGDFIEQFRCIIRSGTISYNLKSRMELIKLGGCIFALGINSIFSDNRVNIKNKLLELATLIENQFENFNNNYLLKYLLVLFDYTLVALVLVDPVSMDVYRILRRQLIKTQTIKNIISYEHFCDNSLKRIYYFGFRSCMVYMLLLYLMHFNKKDLFVKDEILCKKVLIVAFYYNNNEDVEFSIADLYKGLLNKILNFDVEKSNNFCEAYKNSSKIDKQYIQQVVIDYIERGGEIKDDKILSKIIIDAMLN